MQSFLQSSKSFESFDLTTFILPLTTRLDEVFLYFILFDFPSLNNEINQNHNHRSHLKSLSHISKVMQSAWRIGTWTWASTPHLQHQQPTHVFNWIKGRRWCSRSDSRWYSFCVVYISVDISTTSFNHSYQHLVRFSKNFDRRLSRVIDRLDRQQKAPNRCWIRNRLEVIGLRMKAWRWRPIKRNKKCSSHSEFKIFLIVLFFRKKIKKKSEY